MNRPHRVIVLLIAFLLTLHTISLAGQFRVTRVSDGDTVKAEGHDIEIIVRLVAIVSIIDRIISAGILPP